MPGYSAVKNVISISKLPRIIVEGLFTHFALQMKRTKHIQICSLKDLPL